MAVKNTSYTLADILGEPITEQEALALIKQATDSDTFRSFNIMEEACRRKLLQFLMGKSGLSITYDSVFKHVMMPGGTTDRLEQFLSVILGEPVQIKQILPQEGSQIAESGSFIIADIIVSTRDGSIMNVEIQKIGYHFPGERASCYTADMIMRQYNYKAGSMAEIPDGGQSGKDGPVRKPVSGISAVLSGYHHIQEETGGVDTYVF